MDIKKTIFQLKLNIGRRHALSKWRDVLSFESLSSSQMREIVEEKKKALVANAFQKNAFYRHLYSTAGFELRDMEQPDWFEHLPILTKNDIREHFAELITPGCQRYMRISSTGGSTGLPVKTGYDGRIPEEVYSWRQQWWFGVHPWEDHAYVWRDTRRTHLAKIKNRLLWFPTRHVKLDASIMTEESIKRFLKDYNVVRPTLLYGYVGAITQLAQYLLDHMVTVHSPKMVWVTSAPLSSVQRDVIARAFNSIVCDQYGSCEIRAIAQQCPQCKGLHVNVDHVNVEFVDQNNLPVPKGDYGRTLLSNLEDYVFPLIRYENGDRGRWLQGPCPCGRALPCIDSVKGRESESFRLPSGRVVNGEFLTTIFDEHPDFVKGFRVVQKKDRSIIVEYIPAVAEKEVLKVLESFAEKLRNEVPVRFLKVAEIPHDRGKTRFIIVEK